MVMIARVRDKGAPPIKWHIGKSKKLRPAFTDTTKLLIFHIQVQTMMQLNHRFSCWQFLLNVMTWFVLKLDNCLLPAGVLIFNIIRFQAAKGCCWLFFFFYLFDINSPGCQVWYHGFCELWAHWRFPRYRWSDRYSQKIAFNISKALLNLLIHWPLS